jgi:hypothetical protein
MTLFPCSFRPFCASRVRRRIFFFPATTAGTGHRNVPVQSWTLGTRATGLSVSLPVELLWYTEQKAVGRFMSESPHRVAARIATR